MEFIGRVEELKILTDEYEKPRSSFIAVYGRRRIGKTELIDHFVKSVNCPVFSVTGVYNSTKKSHLDHFAYKLILSFGIEKPELDNWDEAFQLLKINIIKTAKKSGCKFTVFIDELPWIAEMKNRGFKSALSLFWNDFASKRDDIFLIVCGSATSWIINNILSDKGSLANRLTAIIHLHGFNLKETKLFLKSIGIKGLSHKTILDYYMVLGGVAHYLLLLSPTESFIQNIQRLFFSQQGVLRTEYYHLFSSLFKKSKVHEIIAGYLSSTWSGMTLSELSKKKGLQTGSVLFNALRELEESGFVVKRMKYKQKSRDVFYCIEDPFIFFYTKWVKGTNTSDLSQNRNYFYKIALSNSWKIWCGYAFENICHKHLYEIKKGLSIGNVITQSYYWTFKGDRSTQGAQIDILLERDDNVVNIIECKYHNSEFTISRKYGEILKYKADLFYQSSSYKGSVSIVMVTTFAVKKNEYYNNLISNEVTIDTFF